jgi:cell wall-associated NlpC family hydrolase
MANLHTAENTLNAQQAQLQEQQGQAQQAVTTEQNAVQQNNPGDPGPEEALAQENGKIATLVPASSNNRRKPRRRRTKPQNSPRPGWRRPRRAGLNDAAAAPDRIRRPGCGAGRREPARRPLRLGWRVPRGSADPGFDCSGLTAWSWGQVGVGLPHYSGAQMSDSTPVPLSDLQPGDLLFYGPGGSEHVAMYVSPGTMIEAPETGSPSI